MLVYRSITSYMEKMEMYELDSTVTFFELDLPKFLFRGLHSGSVTLSLWLRYLGFHGSTTWWN